MTLRVALAEDEPLARERLANMLMDGGCEVVAQLEHSTALLAWLKGTPQVDALFLDIHMPGASTFEVLEELQGIRLPPLVFVTAHPEHSLQAFEVAAVDYLLKPVRKERLAQTLERLKQGAQPRPEPPPLNPAETRFPVRAGEGHAIVDLRRTSHFEAEEDAVWAWVQGQRFRTQWRRLSEVEAAFPRATFLRIQRHLLLRPEMVSAIRPLQGERLLARVAEGVELEVSRSATPLLKERLGL